MLKFKIGPCLVFESRAFGPPTNSRDVFVFLVRMQLRSRSRRRGPFPEIQPNGGDLDL